MIKPAARIWICTEGGPGLCESKAETDHAWQLHLVKQNAKPYDKDGCELERDARHPDDSSQPQVIGKSRGRWTNRIKPILDFYQQRGG